MKFIRATDGGRGDPVLIPLDNLQIIIKDRIFFAEMVMEDGTKAPMKYIAVGPTVAESIVEI